MNEKEILKLAVWGLQDQIKQRCARIAGCVFFETEELDELRILIEQLDKLNERLKSE